MYTSVIEYVSTCKKCQKSKTSHLRKAPLSSLPILEPFARVHVDHIGPLEECFRHPLVVIDSTTFFCEEFPTKTTTAEETADILFREIICRYGAVKATETDGGSAFRNKLMSEVCRLCILSIYFPAQCIPRGYAKVERANKTLMSSLKIICDKQENWVNYVAPVLFSYRASVAIPLGLSPFYALFGRQMSLGIDLQLLQEIDSAPSTDAYMTDLKSRLELTHDIVQKNMTDSAQRTKLFYDRNTRTPDISVG